MTTLPATGALLCRRFDTPIRIDADNEATVALEYGNTAYYDGNQACNLEFGQVFFSVVGSRLKGGDG